MHYPSALYPQWANIMKPTTDYITDRIQQIGMVAPIILMCARCLGRMAFPGTLKDDVQVQWTILDLLLVVYHS